MKVMSSNGKLAGKEHKFHDFLQYTKFIRNYSLVHKENLMDWKIQEANGSW